MPRIEGEAQAKAASPSSRRKASTWDWMMSRTPAVGRRESWRAPEAAEQQSEGQLSEKP
jgi:hypothetical protein